jgi:pimeloyl-ACP methyl ester carboxylesterase
MPKVISKDGTIIAFDKVGFGPAVILVNGALSFRAFDPTLGQLAELLSKDFTVYNYDRRGRGESSDTKPFAKEREIEDIQALVEDAGGKAMLFGVSSGGALTLEAAALIPGITKAVVYEIPFIVDDSRKPIRDYEGRANKLVAEGKLDELMNVLLPEVFDLSNNENAETTQPEQDHDKNQNDQTQAMMKAMYAVLPTIPYDAAFVSRFMEGNPLSVEYWSKVKVPVLVSVGGASAAWFKHTADALAKVLPDARLHTFKDQTHAFSPQVLAPTLSEFYKSASIL